MHASRMGSVAVKWVHVSVCLSIGGLARVLSCDAVCNQCQYFTTSMLFLLLSSRDLFCSFLTRCADNLRLQEYLRDNSPR